MLAHLRIIAFAVALAPCIGNAQYRVMDYRAYAPAPHAPREADVMRVYDDPYHEEMKRWHEYQKEQYENWREYRKKQYENWHEYRKQQLEDWHENRKRQYERWGEFRKHQ